MGRFWGSLLVVVALVAGCGDAGTSSPPTGGSGSAAVAQGEGVPTDPSSLPEAPAPQSLAEADLPATRDGILALFEGLPLELAGGRRTIEPPTPERLGVTYGATGPVGCGSVGFQALDVSTGGFWPEGWTSEMVVAMFTSGADWDVEDYGRDDGLFWVTFHTSCWEGDSPDEDLVHSAMWGRAGSPWLFSATAGSPESRDALTAAFVAAAG